MEDYRIREMKNYALAHGDDATVACCYVAQSKDPRDYALGLEESDDPAIQRWLVRPTADDVRDAHKTLEAMWAEEKGLQDD